MIEIMLFIIIVLAIAILIFIIFNRPVKKVFKDERGWYLKESSFDKAFLLIRYKNKTYAVKISKQEMTYIKAWMKGVEHETKND
ncbi:MAG: hypothetical protein IKE95_03790 [Methanobrevibacter sp.]|nr:hypothetical protein [Methanobrevibacter sp.]